MFATYYIHTVLLHAVCPTNISPVFLKKCKNIRETGKMKLDRIDNTMKNPSSFKKWANIVGIYNRYMIDTYLHQWVLHFTSK